MRSSSGGVSGRFCEGGATLARCVESSTASNEPPVNGRADVVAYDHAGNHADVVAFGQPSATTPLVAYDSSAAGNAGLALPDGAKGIVTGKLDGAVGTDLLLLFDGAGKKRFVLGAQQSPAPHWITVTGTVAGTGTLAPVVGNFDGEGHTDLVWLD